MTQENGTGASNQNGDIHALVDDKISKDTDFQTSLTSMTQEDADKAIADKKAELIKAEYSSIAEQAKKDKELAENYKVRAEKAEKGLKPKDPEVSFDDTYALIEAKVHRDDISEVKDYAKLKGISIAEALKSGVVKTILAEKEELRKTASATNTQSNRTHPQMPSDDEILDKASKNDLPDDVKKLADARFNKKKAQKK